MSPAVGGGARGVGPDRHTVARGGARHRLEPGVRARRADGIGGDRRLGRAPRATRVRLDEAVDGRTGSPAVVLVAAHGIARTARTAGGVEEGRVGVGLRVRRQRRLDRGPRSAVQRSQQPASVGPGIRVAARAHTGDSGRACFGLDRLFGVGGGRVRTGGDRGLQSRPARRRYRRRCGTGGKQPTEGARADGERAVDGDHRAAAEPRRRGHATRRSLPHPCLNAFGHRAPPFAPRTLGSARPVGNDPRPGRHGARLRSAHPRAPTMGTLRWRLPAEPWNAYQRPCDARGTFRLHAGYAPS